MPVRAEWVRYGEAGVFSGYMARPSLPENERLPAVVVLQEIWGVDDHIQDVTRRLAAAGYLAFAPDLYARGGERPRALTEERIDRAKQFLDSLPPGAWGNPEERARALAALPAPDQAVIGETLQALFAGLNPDGYMEQLLATTRFLREACPFSQGQGVASVGFCMGGALSARLACRDPLLRGAVVFYGQAPPAEMIPSIQCPVRGFYGALDKRITEAVPEFAAAMREAGKDFASQVYDGAGHAFFNDTRRSYHVAAARDAYVRTLSFLRDVLAE
ncbi:carboxymethylenebutenolidase [Alicyclobacillus cellulosilyticus]|uniref:Carboxymethylenebutenolidase n=1 Tax=Alicyclobacillus cellulosilyticus TaxID=1003997 RepID=A0A917JZZ7_9BACL|nr:dienelactone hydrolase family protein [Alicyclobacillus cellulosilyticus]GGI95422.1 carboxymethylenebutenolidase [Alicyclobacillus cellulosilyticus]